MKKVASVFVFIAGILWGTIGLFVRQLNTVGIDSIDLVTIRACTTVILLFLFLFIYKRELLKIKWKDIWCFIGTGIFSIVFFNFCYFKAITMTSLSVAAILLYTAPSIVMILSAFLFKEHMTSTKWVALVATFLGCAFVTGGADFGDSITLNGILVGLGAGLGYALYSIFSRYALNRGYHSLTITFYTFLFALIGTMPLVNRNVLLEQCMMNGKILVSCFAFGLISTVIPYVLYTLGLNQIENSTASIIASIEPVAATIIGGLLFQEEIHLKNIIGIVFVIGAIVVSNYKK